MSLEIKYAEDYGFCMGVTRAVELIQNLIEENPSKRIVTIGPLIHNPWYLAKLKEQGVEAVDWDAPLEPGTIAVVRTHGLPPDQLEQLKAQGAEVVDATCPRVRSSQKIISRYAQDRLLIVAGDRRHGEVVSLCGFAPDSIVVHNAHEAAGVKAQKALVIAQTTISPGEFESICEVLERNIPDLVVKSTICKATETRQEALRRLIPDVDAVLVVGGRSSANTSRLFMIAGKSGIPAAHIESPDEIPAEFASYERVGITAGASTPDEIVRAVSIRLKEMSEIKNG